MFGFLFRREVAPGPVHLRNELIEGADGSRRRLFYVGSAFRDRCATAERHARKLPCVTVTRVIDLHDPWSIEFEYEENSFLIDSNSHGTASLFFVATESCPDSILMAVVFHFEPLLG